MIGLGLIIGAAEFSQKGVDLFGNKDSTEEEEEEVGRSISNSPHFEQYMPFSRFKDFHRFLPALFIDESKKEMDPWYRRSRVIYMFSMDSC